MNKKIVLILFIGAFFSAVIHANDYNDEKNDSIDIPYANADNIKIRITHINGGTAKGSIMVLIDGKWYSFLNETRMHQVFLDHVVTHIKP